MERDRDHGGFVGRLVPKGLAAEICPAHNRVMMRGPEGSKTDFGGSILQCGKAGYYCPACNAFRPDKEVVRGE